MLRKYSQFFASLLWLFDMVVVVAAFALAHLLRFHVFTAPAPVADHTERLLVMAVFIFSIVFRWSGLYHSHRLATTREEIFHIFKAVTLSLLLLVAATYFVGHDRYSRLTLGFFGALTALALSSTRTLARRFLASVRRRGRNVRSALVVGAGELGRELVARLERRPEYGIKVAGLLTRDEAKVGSTVAGQPVLGLYDDIERIVAQRQIDQVYVALPLDQHHRLREIMAALATSPADVKVVPDLYQYMTLHGGVEDVDGMPVVALRGGPVHGWDAVAKRAFDLVFGLPILLLAAPVMIVTALAIKLTSHGPVFYRQDRMGLDGRTFSILKFRSMRIDAEKDGFRQASKQDDRTTAVGRFIRRVSIDELPQILNVLAGDMSLVGPRPDALNFIRSSKLMDTVPGYNLRYKVKCGMTGLAQVEGVRGLAPVEKRVERDLWYIRNWSLWLDFKILVRTALGGFLSKNAY